MSATDMPVDENGSPAPLAPEEIATNVEGRSPVRIPVPPRHAGLVDWWTHPPTPRHPIVDGMPPSDASSESRTVSVHDVVEAVQGPLIAVRTGVERLANSGASALDSEQVEILDAVRDRILSVLERVDRLLAPPSNDIPRSRVALSPRPIDLGTVVDRAMRSMMLDWRSSTNSIRLSIPEDLPLIHADPDCLHEAVVLIFEHLLGQAPHPSVSVGASATDASVVAWFESDAIRSGAPRTDGDSEEGAEKVSTAETIVEEHGGTLAPDYSEEGAPRLLLTLPRPNVK